MTTKIIIDFIIMSVTFGSGMVIGGYDDFARAKGWPVAERLSGGRSLLKIVSLLALFIALGVSFYAYRWWSPLIVLVCGFIYGFLSLVLLKQRVQALAALGVVAGLVLCFAYVL